MTLTEEIKVAIEKMKKETDKTCEVYSVKRSCMKTTEVTLVGEDDKGRKFCRVFYCQE